MPMGRLAVMTSLLSQPKPRIIYKKTFSADSDTLSIPIPKGYLGKMCVIGIFNVGGTSTPPTLTGFTQIINGAASASGPGMRWQYAFLTGTESESAVTTGATACVAHLLIIDGGGANRMALGTVQTSNTAGTSTTADPPSLTSTNSSSGTLFIGHATWISSQTLSAIPNNATYRNFQEVSATSLYSAIVAERQSSGVMDFGAFEGSTSAGFRAGAVAIRAA